MKRARDDGELDMDSDEEAEQAARIARIAAKAEAKAMERAGGQKSKQPRSLDEVINKKETGGGGQVKFMTKKEREKAALARLEQRREEVEQQKRDAMNSKPRKGDIFKKESSNSNYGREEQKDQRREEAKSAREQEKAREMIRNQYLGGKKEKKKVIKASEKFTKIFQFDWDTTEDTSQDLNPLYKNKAQLNPVFGRGYIAGVDMKEQRKNSRFVTELLKHRQQEQRRAEEAEGMSRDALRKRDRDRREQLAMVEAKGREQVAELEKSSIGLTGSHWKDKKLADMTERDWRIFREDFDIRIRGGKAPLPLRFWKEGKFPEGIDEAIEDLGYKNPSAIQRQAIPVGMQYRDMIGVAETGSGKTAAFGIPMITYILQLPQEHRERTPEDGPLALAMAPTRELAQQIEEEIKKFCKYCGIKVMSVVGGQDIEAQGFQLRKGVDIIIGTPGRLVDCLEKHYLVLNQCSYIVMDEADRMIDMGFEEQVLTVLDGMGGTLKDEDEDVAMRQEIAAKEKREIIRITAMFSATMPAEVERMAKKYMRHPVTIQIGDAETGFNTRIKQEVIFMSESQKLNRAKELMSGIGYDKAIIFCNTKRCADGLGKDLEKARMLVGVLHGGKVQNLREDILEDFRAGEANILVATDVASRGLDIPDVALVLNYELPNKIQTYTHRIGRTGRAGKDGHAISFLTENDEDIMYDLKQYLEHTGAPVPDKLQHHAAAKAPVGARRDDGELVNRSRDKVQFAKK
ncbi:unnamed protein product [Chrysoparadoxa australica]